MSLLEVLSRKREGDVLLGHRETIGERLKRDRRGIDGVAAGAVRRLRQAGQAGHLPVPGALPEQRLLSRDSPDGSSQSPTMVAQWAADRESGPELSR